MLGSRSSRPGSSTSSLSWRFPKPQSKFDAGVLTLEARAGRRAGEFACFRAFGTGESELARMPILGGFIMVFSGMVPKWACVPGSEGCCCCFLPKALPSEVAATFWKETERVFLPVRVSFTGRSATSPSESDESDRTLFIWRSMSVRLWSVRLDAFDVLV
jgi:hypothetical protein